MNPLYLIAVLLLLVSSVTAATYTLTPVLNTPAGPAANLMVGVGLQTGTGQIYITKITTVQGNADQAGIWFFNGTLVANTSFAGANATFSSPITLLASTHYILGIRMNTSALNMNYFANPAGFTGLVTGYGFNFTNSGYGPWDGSTYTESPPVLYGIQSIDFNLPPYLNVTVGDEMTGASINANISVSNGSSIVYLTPTNAVAFTSLPQGAVTIIVSNSSYAQRTYYATIAGTTAIVLNTYLLPLSMGSYIIFNTRTNAGNSIMGANIAVTKFIGGSWVTVGQQLTDSTGSANFFLSPVTSYGVIVQAAGYNTVVVNVTPAYSPITIIMVSGNGTTYYPGFWFNVAFYLTPTGSVLDYSNQTQKINFTVKDYAANITSFSLSIYFNSTLIYFSNNTGNASGGSIVATMNNTYYFNLGSTYPQVYVFGQINKAGFAPVNVSATYLIANVTYSPYSLQGALDYTATMPQLHFFIVLLGLAALIVIPSLFGGGGPITILIMVLLMAVFTLAGFFSNSLGVDWVGFTLFAAVGVMLALRSL